MNGLEKLKLFCPHTWQNHLAGMRLRTLRASEVKRLHPLAKLEYERCKTISHSRRGQK